jgi:hypothetical protein
VTTLVALAIVGLTWTAIAVLIGAAFALCRRGETPEGRVLDPAPAWRGLRAYLRGRSA